MFGARADGDGVVLRFCGTGLQLVLVHIGTAVWLGLRTMLGMDRVAVANRIEDSGESCVVSGAGFGVGAGLLRGAGAVGGDVLRCGCIAIETRHLDQYPFDATCVGKFDILRHPLFAQNFIGHLDHDVVGFEQTILQVVAVATESLQATGATGENF